ncbi:Mso1, N-terminal domain [Fusarium oxysporum f. sp. vasinfectum]|nr:Mso1, N-terminal domain [Fusarium oxysporum f. sp. vasinfectum]
MASWYSNLVQKTSSQISSLRQNLLSGEQDGDTEDDTHVCRVLRGYYTEKGRPFPSWLPPDPKAPAQQPIQPVMTPQAGQRLGAQGQQHGGLSSLWDNGPQQPQQQAPQSLRAGGGRTPASLQPGGGGDINRRPLPSQQRAGSYQNTGGQFGRPETASVPPGGASGGGGGGSAQDRLRQRLWGGGSRTTSPQAGNRFAPGGMYDQASGGGNAGLRRGGLPSGPRGYR